MNTVLIIEDEQDIRELLAFSLKQEGFGFLEAESGEQGLALAKKHQPSIILLDVMLPGMDGFALLGILRHAEIPVIFLTAKNDVASKVRGLRDGADDYLVKPFEVLELLVRIEKVLERAGKLRQVLEVGPLTINLLERSVRQNGEEILLKPMEFDLLVMLAKNKNIALSRERLLHGVWGVDYQGETRTVDVHIAQIRKKLGLNEQIKTISKLGYRLED